MEVIHLLGIAGCAQGGGGEHLGETTLEQAGTMDPSREDPSQGADGPHLIQGATIHSLAVFEDLLAHQGFGQRLEAVTEQLRIGGGGHTDGIVLLQAGDGFSGFRLDGIKGLVALILGLVEFLEHLADRLGALLLQVSRHCGVLLGGLRLHLFDAQILQQLLLGFDQFADRFVTEVDRFDHILFG